MEHDNLRFIDFVRIFSVEKLIRVYIKKIKYL